MDGDVADEPYRDLRDEVSEDAIQYKQTIQTAWNGFSNIINDSNFQSNARNNFWSAAWHLFLLDNLRECGYDLRPTGDGQPDIRVELNGRTIWIEAVSVTPGVGENQVNPPEDAVYEPSWDKILLRLISGLESKKAAFDTYIQNGVVKDGDACIIAMNSVAVKDSDFWRHDIDSEINTVLFGLGNLLTHLNAETLEPIKEEFAFRPNVKKVSTNTDINIFFYSRENQSQNISGVIFSPKRPFYRGEAHLKWVHNPNTTRPIKQGDLRIGVEQWVSNRSLQSHRWWPTIS